MIGSRAGCPVAGSHTVCTACGEYETQQPAVSLGRVCGVPKVGRPCIENLYVSHNIYIYIERERERERGSHSTTIKHSTLYTAYVISYITLYS